MFEFLVHLVVSALLLLLVANLVDGFDLEGTVPALLAALLLGLVNAIVRPLVVVLTIPITILTLGLFLFVVNALMIWLVAAIVPGFRVRGFVPALIGSLLFSLLNIAVSMVFGV
jgi:putative membrane protein